MRVCVCSHARVSHKRACTAKNCLCRKFREQLVLPVTQGEPVSLIPELEALRVEAHRRLQESEYEFWRVDRALAAAKRAQRDKEAK